MEVKGEFCIDGLMLIDSVIDDENEKAPFEKTKMETTYTYWLYNEKLLAEVNDNMIHMIHLGLMELSTHFFLKFNVLEFPVWYFL